MAFSLKNRKDQPTGGPRIGDVVDVFITGATEFGAFGHTGNGVYLGMIHRSEIGEKTVTDAREHFLVGEKVKAIVVGRRPDGKFNFSTKRLVLKPRRSLPEADGSGERPIPTIRPFRTFTEDIQRPVEPSPTGELEKLLGRNLGRPLSLRAKDKLEELCRKYGPVRLTVSLLEQTADPGVAVLSWVEETMKGGNN